MDDFSTEFEFDLPKGYVDSTGTVHKHGVMRLATAADEILPLRDPRVVQNPGYLSVILLSRVITSLGTVPKVDPRVIERLLDQTYQSSDSYFVVTAAEMMDTMNSMLEILMTILVVIAAISLLVGGIGIMNIMLVSVTERTREIGIRKSLGAKGRDIRSQFIIEAGTTSAVGGVIGIVLGVMLANAATVIVGAVMGGSDGFTATPSLGGILVSFGVSVGVGVLFGYLPANKAAKLNPIDALRYD